MIMGVRKTTTIRATAREAPTRPSGPMTTTDAVMTMTVEMRAIDGRERAVVQGTVEVPPYDANNSEVYL